MPRRPVSNGAFIYSDRWSGGMASFKSMGYSPVKGGRWKIRKLRKPNSRGNYWLARTDGKAKQWNRSFLTHDQAVRWAHFVSLMYKVNAREVADKIIRIYLKEMR